MNEIKLYESYGEYKKILDTELQKSAEGFVKIGFLLKQARDTDILVESGYKNYIEFAQAEYGIDKTTVSRFIRINDKFAEEGNSESLQEQYRGYGYAKLAIMLQLPDEVNNILTPEFSKTEIQSIKEEVDEESKISDLEVLMEEEPLMTKYCDTNLYKALMKMCHDEPQIYIQLHKAVEEIKITEERIKAIAEIIAPTETKVYMIRIPGIGRLALSFKGLDQKIEVINIRNGEKEEFSWEDMLQTFLPLILDEDAKNSWSRLYLESFNEPKAEPQKEEVAPVQQKNTETKKESKVTKAKTEGNRVNHGVEKEKIVEPVPRDKKSVENETQAILHDIDKNIPIPDPVEDVSEDEKEIEKVLHNEQIPGQDTIEQHPEYMPNDSLNIDAVVEPLVNTEHEAYVTSEKVEKESYVGDVIDTIKLEITTNNMSQNIFEIEKILNREILVNKKRVTVVIEIEEER